MFAFMKIKGYTSVLSFTIVCLTLFTTIISNAQSTISCSAYQNWVQGRYYVADAIVKYSNGKLYKAKFANPGYNPTISTYFWGPQPCLTTTSPSVTSETCNSPNWVQGQDYAAGTTVRYSNGQFYFAKFANPGYNPTVSTYFWSATSCAKSGSTPTATLIAVPSGGLSIPSALNPIPPANIEMTCVDSQRRFVSSYAVENNRWGADGVSPAQQCVGIGGVAADGSISAKWNWNYGTGVNEVKGYPSIIYGQKPGYPALVGSTLPKKVNDITVATTGWNTSEGANGKGHNAYDIWLTRDPNFYGGFLNTPITHEIMISTNNWGTYGDFPNPAWIFENEVVIDGIRFRVTKADDFGFGNKWRFIVFKMLDDRRVGSLNLMPFIQYMKSKGLITGNEYMSSIEFGTEPEFGSGEVQIHGYKVNIK